MIRRIGNLPLRVMHLAFAPDGKRLAATLGGTNGVRVFDIADGRQIGADADYGNASFGADFDSSGRRLVTSCYDGFIRLYAVEANGLRLIAKHAASGGKQPLSVKFSPDNSKIAVGFHDSTAINVLSAMDLGLSFAPDTTRTTGNLDSVAWSATGDTLFAGGQYDVDGNNLIRLWKNGGRGAFQDVTAARVNVLDIQPLPNGGIIYSVGGAAWGIINRTGNRTRFVTSAIADYRDLLEHFLISTDGAEVAFGYEVRGKSPARFSILQRRLETGANQNLKPPRTTGLNVTD